jgi:HEPN domain-containing protein
MPKTIGSVAEFKKDFPSVAAHRAEAVEAYLKGGVIKVQGTRLVYPTTKKLDKQIQDKTQRIDALGEQLKGWGAREREMKTDKLSDSVKRVATPVFWEHQVKLMTDKDYKEVYELVKPPMHLINQKKWNKRLSIFVKNGEYRLRLKEARLSQIGKKRDKMDKEVETRMNFNRQLAAINKDKLEKQKSELETQVSAMREVMRWARESGV